MTEPRQIVAEGILVEFDPEGGFLARIAVTRDGRTTTPFHRAPWADAPRPVAGTEDAPHLAGLAGDFFCAPFAAADVEPAPAHGWTANSRWLALDETAGAGSVTARFALDRPVMGARVVKEITLRDGHPFVYQRHSFAGGTGAVSVANHAMVSLPSGAELSFSPKRFAETPSTAVEPDPARGRSLLAYPARTADLAAFPAAAGRPADLTRYPLGDRHEDFVMLVEAADAVLGWSAVRRLGEADLALMLKNPQRLPATMLWFSNGGRDYPPWNGRHLNVLGVEDAAAYSIYGHQASISPNPLSQAGIPTAIRLAPQGSVDVRHVIGAVPVAAAFSRVARIDAGAGRLTVTDATGAQLAVPYDDTFLAEG